MGRYILTIEVDTEAASSLDALDQIIENTDKPLSAVMDAVGSTRLALRIREDKGGEAE